MAEKHEVRIFRLLRSKKGQSLVEYALIVALIAVAAVGAMTYLSNRAGSSLSAVGSRIN